MVSAYVLSLLALFGSKNGTITINEPDHWKLSAVVYAEVNEVVQIEGTMHIIGVKPIAVLTGNFDAALKGPVRTAVDIGSPSSHIEQAPPIGAKVLVFLSHGSDWPEGLYRTYDSILEMPDRKGIAEVNGFDDPKVAQTIETLRKLRALHREGKRGPTMQELTVDANAQNEKKKVNDDATETKSSAPQAQRP